MLMEISIHSGKAVYFYIKPGQMDLLYSSGVGSWRSNPDELWNCPPLEYSKFSWPDLILEFHIWQFVYTMQAQHLVVITSSDTSLCGIMYEEEKKIMWRREISYSIWVILGFKFHSMFINPYFKYHAQFIFIHNVGGWVPCSETEADRWDGWPLQPDQKSGGQGRGCPSHVWHVSPPWFQ